MRPRPATRDGRSKAGGIRGVVYGRSATRASRGEEDGTTGVREGEMISGFGFRVLEGFRAQRRNTTLAHDLL
jgi:hypothetical protein